VTLPSQDRTDAGSDPRHATLHTLFWVFVVTLYLLGALSLLMRAWLDPDTTASVETPAIFVTVIATAPPVTVPPATALPAAPASATPFPTLTPRSTLYPTLTPRP